jgi:hypothetical protein
MHCQQNIKFISQAFNFWFSVITYSIKCLPLFFSELIQRHCPPHRWYSIRQWQGIMNGKERGTDWLWFFKSIHLEGMNLLYAGRKHCFLVYICSYYIPRTLLKCIYIYVSQLGFSHDTDKVDRCPLTISDNKHWYWLNACFHYFFHLFWKSNVFFFYKY